MATPYVYNGRGAHKKAYSITLTSSSATAATFIVPTGYQGTLNVPDSYFNHTTGIKETSSAAGALAITYTPTGGAEVSVGTWANTASSSATTVGTITGFTTVASYNDGIKLSAGDIVRLKHTKATGGAAAGAVNVFLSIDIFRINV